MPYLHHAGTPQQQSTPGVTTSDSPSLALKRNWQHLEKALHSRALPTSWLASEVKKLDKVQAAIRKAKGEHPG